MYQFAHGRWMAAIAIACGTWISVGLSASPGLAQPDLSQDPSQSESVYTDSGAWIDQTVECEVLVVGGGLSGAATAYEALLAGRTVCLTELTDWIGGQISSQGTSALDEANRQRQLLFYPRGYNELRSRIEDFYDQLNPGDCWVSASCFLPRDAHTILWEQLEEAADEGDGTLLWFPSTVIKTLEMNDDGTQMTGAIAIQHQPQPGTAPLNTEPLSQVIEDIYRYEDSDRFAKTVIQFVPLPQTIDEDEEADTPVDPVADWYVVDATETGELIALADVPYRLGLDPRSHLNPSSASATGDPYCTQGFTYTFAMEQTEEPQPHNVPEFYDQYAPYYSYEREDLADFNAVFTYRRIWSPDAGDRPLYSRFGVALPAPGDISMQNWTWGNDYRPGASDLNLIYTRDQLIAQGQLDPDGWMGGLRQETLRRGEENAIGFYYWLVAGETDSQLGDEAKEPHPNHRLLAGLETPMGTAHGLSKYPYMREGRRIIGRPSSTYANGFSVNEVDISRLDYREDPFYAETLTTEMYRNLWTVLSGLETTQFIRGNRSPETVTQRTRSTIFPDAIGIAQYAIDFHPCMELSPPETPGNIERTGSRRAHGQAYPAQIPLRATIPQQIDNLLIAGKSIATSHIAAAAYRVHSFEWSVGAAVGTTIDFALDENVLPYQLVDNLPRPEPQLEQLQRRLAANNNPTAFPDTSIFNLDWDDWRVW